MAVLAKANGAHIVKKGDTLYSIATANKVSVQKLMSLNGITKPTNLQIGKRLIIPSASSSSSKKSASVSLKASTVTRSSSVKKSKTVIIDPGHGGRDKGAVWGGVRESDLNLKTAFKLEYYLKRAGYNVVLTRRSDKYVSLTARAAIANRYRNAVFVSIHYNATRETWVHGGETFHGGSSTSRYLASSMQRNLVSNCRVRNRGTRYGRFSVLHNTNCAAALIECGFISNSKERARCNTSSYQDAAARAILAGIERWDRSY
ncbi:N-acetylmuramoyl-L-alanine amidase [Roseibacillus persicicus]|uniref:N-acetylmuramoyl-L-alanine amidase n=1 Tax=Roseibacillus persicicus TaxID=454148 RepID=UPI00398ACF2E